jgi:hypothetical protein
MGHMRNRYKILVEIPEESKHSENLAGDVKIILK